LLLSCTTERVISDGGLLFLVAKIDRS
jgi:hypothetical protein